MPDERPPHLGWDMGKRFLLAGLIIAVLTGAVTATAALNRVSDLAKRLFPRSSHIAVPGSVVSPVYSGGPQTFLLIGSDRRALTRSAADRTNPPHSDTLMLVRFDPNEGQTSVLSIPRDLEVSITAPNGAYYPAVKVNEAYTLGFQTDSRHVHDPGAVLAAETVSKLLGIKLNGVIDTTFGGFMRIVGKLGCVYVNVDHRYYNPNGTGYASINLQPGYQKLCYTNALDYVRYRHTDSDFVRVARQQDFLRNAREQISVGTLYNHLDDVANAIGQSMSTSIEPSASNLIELLKLIGFSQSKPLRQVQFRFLSANAFVGTGKNAASFVTTSPQLIQQTVQDFLFGNQHVHLPSTPSSSAATGRHHRRAQTLASSASAAGLYASTAADRNAAAGAATAVPYPLLFGVRDRNGRDHRGYVAVFRVDQVGGYYDVEGMNWVNPPFMKNPSQIETLGGRQLRIFTDGGKIKLVAFTDHGTLYWVNNTLLEGLSNQQMLDIARSMHPIQ
jgi:polyisoprenyl-teichoic acid--peptidoglycan teichoic acid transferase